VCEADGGNIDAARTQSQIALSRAFVTTAGPWDLV